MGTQWGCTQELFGHLTPPISTLDTECQEGKQWVPLFIVYRRSLLRWLMWAGLFLLVLAGPPVFGYLCFCCFAYSGLFSWYHSFLTFCKIKTSYLQLCLMIVFLVSDYELF